MNSEEKLMAKKIEQANNNKLNKQKSSKLARIGSGNDRKKQSGLKKNSSQYMASTSSGLSHRIKDKPNEKYTKYTHTKKLVNRQNKKRIGSPTAESDKQNEDNTYYEREKGKMKKKNLRIGSDNNRKDPLNHYPFPLTPLEKAAKKPIDIDDDLGVVKSQSTRNKGKKSVDFLGKQYPDPTKIILPNHEPTKCSVKRNGVVKAYGANTNQGIVRNYNEDRVSIILNIMKPPNKTEIEYWPKCSFFGVYDGHGGSNCADFLRDNLHQFIIRDESFPDYPKEAIKSAFAKAEKCFLEMAEIDAIRTGDFSLLDKSGS